MTFTILKIAIMMAVRIHEYDYRISSFHSYFIGDCCLSVISIEFCRECICHRDGTKHPNKEGYSTDMSLFETTVATCDAPWYAIGDGFCDDVYNTKACNFDLGLSLGNTLEH